jgi:hypothetical protein
MGVGRPSSGNFGDAFGVITHALQLTDYLQDGCRSRKSPAMIGCCVGDCNRSRFQRLAFTIEVVCFTSGILSCSGVDGIRGFVDHAFQNHEFV